MASYVDHSSFPRPSSSHPRWWSQETVAVVTGANRGIGFAIAKRLSELGLRVVLTARDEEKGQAAVKSLHERRLPVVFRQLDVADTSSIRAFALWLRNELGGLDILVNNAGVSFNDIYSNSVDHAETVTQTNFHGPKQLIEVLLPLFRQSQNTSRILNISSRLGLLDKVRNPSLRAMLQDEEKLTEEKISDMVSMFLQHVENGSWEKEGWPELWTDYSVSKLALNAYSTLLARRFDGLGLSVNCYCPGFTMTGMTNGRGHHTAEEAAEVAVNLVLMNPDVLPNGKFFKLWSNYSPLPSKM